MSKIDKLVEYLLTMRYRPSMLDGGAVKILILKSNKVIDTEYAITERGQKQLDKILR